MFHTSLPVIGADFFDRLEQTERLLALVDKLLAGAPEWLAIVGARKVGKTSLLLEVARRVHDRRVSFVLLDALDPTPLSVEFFRRLALRTVDVMLSSEGGRSLELSARDHADYQARLAASSRFVRLPAALRQRLVKLPSLALDSDGLRICLDLPEHLAVALDAHVLMAIDEFQELASVMSGRQKIDPFPLIRSVWQTHRRTAYVISGSARTLLSDLVTARHSPFFQHFDLMELGPFSREDGIDLLVGASPDECRLEREIARTAVDVIGGHPFYLQLIGDALTRRPHEPDGDPLKLALQEVLFSRTGRLALYLEGEWKRLVGRSTTLAACLNALALADEAPRLVDLAHAIGASPAAAATYLERLGDAVAEEGGRYRLADSTFALWLRWRAPGGTMVPMTLVGDAAEKQVANEMALMGFDLVYQSRASRGAFDLLATRGAQQLGVQVKRSDLPVRFAKSAWNRMVADAKRLGWRWIVAAVDGDHRVSWLDPGLARRGREIRLGEEASIENLLVWLEDR